ncbi:hypothetical protein LTR28_000791 [Elasticomyces elasticus]|nr:hypothetical protein LTR28_000791 [Elasticomyces elasticus]
MDEFMRKVQDRRIDSKYSLVRKLGEGGFGAVYLGRDFDTGEEVALKLEHRDQCPSILEEEVETYATFQGLPGFPEVYWYGWQDDYKVMVFELLGPSLEDLFVFCGRRFSLKTTIMIMDQLLLRLEALHSKGLLHRDVKPQNCLLGNGTNGNVVYVTDFGLAQEYAAKFDDFKEFPGRRSRLVGTARYASIRGHSGQGDDLESLGYMMIYFMRGGLPWQGLKAHSREEKDWLVKEKKIALGIEELCSGLPEEFAEYMRLVKSVQQEPVPNYTTLRDLFGRVARREAIEYDSVFDWTVRLYLQRAE